MIAAPTLIPTGPPPRQQRIVDDWQLLAADCDENTLPGGVPPPARETLLTWNAVVPGGVKFVLSPERRVCLRAELPCTEGRAVPAAAVAVEAGFAEAQRLWRQVDVTPRAAPLPPTAALPAQLVQACTETGWTVNMRADDTLVVDLDVPGGHWPAHLFSLTSNETLVLVELATISAGSTASREAIAILLLLAGGVLRWVRPAVRTIGDRCVAVFEVLLPTAPTAANLVDALCGLSLASRWCAAEANALLDEPVAQECLRVMAPVSVPNRNRQTKEEIPWYKSTPSVSPRAM